MKTDDIKVLEHLITAQTAARKAVAIIAMVEVHNPKAKQLVRARKIIDKAMALLVGAKEEVKK